MAIWQLFGMLVFALIMLVISHVRERNDSVAPSDDSCGAEDVRRWAYRWVAHQRHVSVIEVTNTLVLSADEIILLWDAATLEFGIDAKLYFHCETMFLGNIVAILLDNMQIPRAHMA